MKIKLFADAHVFDEKFQGSRTFIKGIYTVLARKPGIVLHLAAYDIENLKKNFPDGKDIVFIKYKSKSGVFRLLYDIPSIIRKYKIEYAHFQYIVPPFKNCKFIVTTHDVIFNEYPAEFSLAYRLKKTFLYKLSAVRSNIVTTVSEFSKESIINYLGVNPEKIHVIPNGVADIFFNNYDKASSRKIFFEKYGFEKFILYVSRIEPRKNHTFLLKAYVDLELYAKGYYLVLLGAETIKVPEFDQLIEDLPEHIRSCIYINSNVDDNDILEFYRVATLFVYPSKAEGFGIPPLEAAASRTPVLCSNTSAMREFSFFGDDLIDPFNSDLFMEKLQKVVSMPYSMEHLNNLSRTVEKKYTWEKSAEKLYEIIVK